VIGPVLIPATLKSIFAVVIFGPARNVGQEQINRLPSIHQGQAIPAIGLVIGHGLHPSTPGVPPAYGSIELDHRLQDLSLTTRRVIGELFVVRMTAAIERSSQSTRWPDFSRTRPRRA